MLIIRTEQTKDFKAIEQLTEVAFKPMPYAAGNEQFIADKLRKAGKLTISLVAEVDGVIVGHVAFSPVSIDGKDQQWFGVGPVAVSPEFQKSGVGSALMQQGIKQLKAKDARGCALLGDPNYYSRFGFNVDSTITLDDAPAEYFQSLRFNNDTSSGQIIFEQAFSE